MPQKLMDCSKPFMKMYTKPASLSRRRLESKGALKKPFLTKALVILKSIKRKIITAQSIKKYMFMFQQRTIESYCAFCRALSWVSEVFSRVRREAWSAGGRHVFGRRPKTRAAKQREKTRITILRLDRNRKPRMRSLWQLQYYYKNPR